MTDRLPPVPRGPMPWTLVALTAGAGVALMILTTGVYRFGLITSLIFVFFALSIVVVTGLVGQVSLAQAAVAGVAAFAMARFTPDMPFPVNLVLGVVVATVLGTVIGVPALRIRHGQLAVVTLAGAVAVDAFVFRNTVLNPPGEAILPAPQLWGDRLLRPRGRRHRTVAVRPARGGTGRRGLHRGGRHQPGSGRPSVPGRA